MQTFLFVVSDSDDGARIDLFLSEQLKESGELEDTALSRSNIQRLIGSGKVTADGRPAEEKNRKVKAGETVSITVPEATAPDILPEDIQLDIVYEDASLVVVNKPKGLVVHPAPGHTGGTLVNALLFHCGDSLSGINGVKRPGIVHRIDKDTSGLLVVAKDDAAHISLAGQLANHSMTREYRAVLHGNLKEEYGVVDRAIGRAANDRKRFAVDAKHAKPAVTEYELIENLDGFCHVKLRLKTGRTHQIRVHMAAIGRPVAGDPVYGPKNTPKELGGQCLHAKTLGFVHPATGETMLFDSELPDYFTAFLGKKKGK